MKIVYVAPVYKPAIGGGVVYLDMMRRHLLNIFGVNSFTIITEKHPRASKVKKEESDRFSVVRLFPFRAGRHTKDYLSYFAYIIQNFEYFYLLWYLHKNKVNAVFVHSSLHNNPNLMYLVILCAKKIFSKKTRFILDVRDPKLPARRFYQCAVYDRIISCSNNVTDHLNKDVARAKKIIEIPVPVEEIDLSEVKEDEILQRYGLVGKKYIFNGSGCTLEKGINRLLKIVRRVRETDDVLLVVAGKKRYWDDELELAKNEGWLICTGELLHEDALMLSKLSVVDMNASSVDSMPRHTLEAFVNGAKILVPHGIPELENSCPEVVVDYSIPDDVAAKVRRLISQQEVFCNYDWSRHNPSLVFSQYVSLLYEMSI